MKVSIRKFEKTDIPNKVKWINDLRNNMYLHYDLPLEIEKTEKWYEKNKNRTDRYDAIILCDEIPIGVIGLLSVDNDKAEYYITIGEEEYKGKGIAKKASLLLLNKAFKEMRLKKVFLLTEVENISAQKLFESIGFINIGIDENKIYNQSSQKYVERYFYEILNKDFFNKINFKSTPIVFLEHNTNSIFIKRDDLIPFSFGGNKARKALNFFREIDSGEYDVVVTYGSSSSNHCRIVSNMAASRKLPCYIISPKEALDPTYNSKMMKLFGAEITTVLVNDVSRTIDRKLEQLKKDGKKPYFIPGGGHGNLGTQAYVDCYDEICKYEKENNIYFDYIFFASGTGTTQAGLVCGQLIHNDKRKIIGISIARKNPRGCQVVIDSVEEYLKEKRYNISNDMIKDTVIFLDDYTGDGYGKENIAINNTIYKMLKKYGIPMDSTYTAKAYVGMQEYIKKTNINNKNILFIHTGGTPLFFDDLEDLI